MIETKAAFAVRVGVDRTQPTRWAARGMPVLLDGQWTLTPPRHGSSARLIQANGEAIAASGYGFAAPEKPFDSTAHLTEPADQIAVLISTHIEYRLPASASIMAIGAGASVDVACEMLSAVQISAMGDVEEALYQAGIPPPPWDGASILNVKRFAAVDWPAMEKTVAERFSGDGETAAEQ